MQHNAIKMALRKINAACYLLLILIIASNSHAAQINGSTYKQNVIISTGGDNSSSSSYKSYTSIGIIARILNSSAYINQLGFFHLLLLANSQPCTSSNQCEGGFCCSNSCSSSACPGQQQQETGSVSGGTGAGAGGGGGGLAEVLLPEPEEKQEETIDFSVGISSLKEHIPLDSAKTATIAIRNTGNVALNFNANVVTLNDFLFLSDESFALEPGEMKSIEANIIGKKLGSYLGSIEITAGGLKQQIEVIIEVESEKVLFDAKIFIPNSYKEIAPGEDIRAQITLINVGPSRKVDITTTYVIKDNKGNVVYESSETFAVDKQSSFTKSFKIPENLQPGKYIAVVEVRYENSFAVSSELFSVVQKGTSPLQTIIRSNALSILIFAAGGIFLASLSYVLLTRFEFFGKR